MSDEFYCPQCRRYKPLSLRSDKRASSTYLCTYCKQQRDKKLNPGGRLSRLTKEHLQTGRDHDREKRAEQAKAYAAEARAEKLSKLLRGD